MTEVQQVPTGLHLFGYAGVEGTLHARWEAAQQLKREFLRAGRAQQRLMSATGARQDRLTEAARELHQEIGELVCSATCGLAYLQLTEELASLGVPASESLEFFKKCLAVNSRFTSLYYRGHPVTSARAMNADVSLARRRYGLENPPPWFLGTRDRWHEFFHRCLVFPTFVSRERLTSYAIVELPSLMLARFGSTSEEGTPDWLIEPPEAPPERAVVEGELREDLSRVWDRLAQLSELNKQDVYLTQAINERFVDGVARRERRLAEVFGSIRTLADFVLYLDVLTINNFPRFHVEPTNISSMTLKELIDVGVVADDEREAAIQSLVRGSPLARELIALWLEDRLCDGALSSAQQVALEAKPVLGLLFLESAGGRLPPGLLDLKETKKRIFSALVYDVRPLLEGLAPEAIAYLQELLGELRQEPAEVFIWELADLI